MVDDLGAGSTPEVRALLVDGMVNGHVLWVGNQRSAANHEYRGQEQP